MKKQTHWEIKLLEEAENMKDSYNNPGLHHKKTIDCIFLSTLNILSIVCFTLFRIKF